MQQSNKVNKKNMTRVVCMLLATAFLLVIVLLSRSQKAFISKAHAQEINQTQAYDNILLILRDILVSLVRSNSPMASVEFSLHTIELELLDFKSSLRDGDFRTARERAEHLSLIVTDMIPYLTSIDAIDIFPTPETTIKKELADIEKSVTFLEERINNLKSISLNSEKTHLLKIAIKWLDASAIQDNIFNDGDLGFKVDLASKIFRVNQNVSTQMDELSSYRDIVEKDEKTKTAFLDLLNNLATLQNASSDLHKSFLALADKLSTITRQIDRLSEPLEGDVNGDSKVDIFDLVTVAKNFGKKI